MVKFGAVLTGDLVGSSKMSTRDLVEIRESLQDAVSRIIGSSEAKLDMFRGDSWQLLVEDPGKSLRVALYVRASFKARFQADTSVSIGIGSIEKLEENDLSLSLGDAFSRSGRALDRLYKPKIRKHLMALSTSEESRNLPSWPELVVRMCDALVKSWTQPQAEVVSYSLLRLTQEQVAQKLREKKSQQAVGRMLGRANWPVLEEVVEVFEKFDWVDYAN